MRHVASLTAAGLVMLAGACSPAMRDAESAAAVRLDRVCSEILADGRNDRAMAICLGIEAVGAVVEHENAPDAGVDAP